MRGRRIRAADLRRFGGALRGPHRQSVLRATVDGAYVIAILRLRGLAPLLRAPAGVPDGDPAEVRRISDAVDAGMGLLPVSPTCLRRSVTLLRELHRRDLGATMHIGVRHGDTGVEAHAWVQVADEIVNDDPAVVGTYTRLSSARAEQLRANFS